MTAIRRTMAILILSMSLTILSDSSQADQVRPLNLQQLVEGAEIIFEGECTAVRSGRDTESGMIATWFTFRILRGIKGEVGDEYVLKQFGGSDGIVQVQAPSARYTVGENVVLFLYGTSRLGFSSAVGLHQGKFLIQENPDSKVRSVSNGMPVMTVFENMNVTPSALTTQGLKAQGQEILRSKHLELNSFLTEIDRLVQQEKKKNLQEQ